MEEQLRKHIDRLDWSTSIKIFEQKFDRTSFEPGIVLGFNFKGMIRYHIQFLQYLSVCEDLHIYTFKRKFTHKY